MNVLREALESWRGSGDKKDIWMMEKFPAIFRRHFRSNFKLNINFYDQIWAQDCQEVSAALSLAQQVVKPSNKNENKIEIEIQLRGLERS